MVKRVEEFYKELYSSNISVQSVASSVHDSSIPKVTCEEVAFALKSMKRGKAPGEDGISIDLLKDARTEVHCKLAQLYTCCIRKESAPESWCNAIVLLFHKKGDQKDLNNYRPISLSSNVYEVFCKIPTN